ncbi:MAG: methyltransferase domain-containing protein [Magnetococcales bacterium]|nr:methyltransferase domain-containing protein [Magnetococcales bacterium]MBF0113564.1 methyltransferase domain-containing protein [Magnetococcales bacterium]
MPGLSIDYYGSLHLVIPNTVRHVLDVGCGTGGLGNLIKHRDPGVVFDGVELNSLAAQTAANYLDHVYCVNIETDELPFAAAGYDCIIFGDVLEHLYHPLQAIERMKQYLKPEGFILCSIPNAQNYQIISSLLCGNFQYQDGGLLDRTHIRFFTYANMFKLLLDAGLVPELLGFVPETDFQGSNTAYARSTSANREGTLAALEECSRYLGVDKKRFRTYLSAFQLVFKAKINDAYTDSLSEPFPLSIIVPTHLPHIFGDYLLSSPILQKGNPHQLITLTGYDSAASALEEGIKRAVHDTVIFVHQDVYLPVGWDRLFCQRIREVERSFPEFGMIGIHGASRRGNNAVLSGVLVDRHSTLHHADPLPSQVDTIDDCLFALRKEHFPGVDEQLGWYHYGADLAYRFRAIQRDAIVVDALCYHNSMRGATEPEACLLSARRLAEIWPEQLPIVTPRLVVNR